MITRTKKNINVPTNIDSGFALIAVLLFLMILSVIGIAGTHTSNTEIQIAANDRFINTDFYDTERQLINALEVSDAWLKDDDFLSADETKANYSTDLELDLNGDGVKEIYKLEVRCIEKTQTAITGTDGLSDYANDIPADTHRGPAINSGSSDDFELVRFAVTVRSADDRTILQAGVFKAFPASTEE